MKKISIAHLLSFVVVSLIQCATASHVPYVCNLGEFFELQPEVSRALNIEHHAPVYKNVAFTQKLLLFEQYPKLKENLNCLELADLPTPVERLEKYGKMLGIDNLYIKRDDLAGKAVEDTHRKYGGNKIRKLEFLLADAIKRGADELVTFGCVGSNHAVATAVYGKELGFDVTTHLLPQPNSRVVRKNLHFLCKAGAYLQYYSDSQSRLKGTIEYFSHNARHNKANYFIPTGGSCPLGAIGFVNAAFELKKQIDAHKMPEPDVIYLPVGSNGTIAGLLLGLKATGLKSQIVGVATQRGCTEREIVALAQKTNTFLRERDSSFPLFSISEKDIVLQKNFVGHGYGKFTQEAVCAQEQLLKAEGIVLDGTYTAKAFAALAHDIHTGTCKDKKVLFWNTYCCGDDSAVDNFKYKILPRALWKYFEEDVQELDRVKKEGCDEKKECNVGVAAQC